MTANMMYIMLSEYIEEEETGTFSAFCRDLGIATCGKSLKGAKTNLNEAIALTLTTAAKYGELRSFLADRDIRTFGDVPPDEPIEITVTPGITGLDYRDMTHRPYEFDLTPALAM